MCVNTSAVCVSVHTCQMHAKGFKKQPSTYRVSTAPSDRGRCRRCRKTIPLGATRLEICAFVRPGRRTLLLRCTEPGCIDGKLSDAVLAVYQRSDRVPVEAALEGSAEALRVQRAITTASMTTT